MEDSVGGGDTSHEVGGGLGDVILSESCASLYPGDFTLSNQDDWFKFT